MTPRVLYLVHGLPPEEYSGTPLVAHGYASTLANRGWEVAVLHAAGPAPPWRTVSKRLGRGLERAVSDESGDSYMRIGVPRTTWSGSSWSLEAGSHRLEARSFESVAFGRLLERFTPDLLHVIDNVNLPLDFPEMAARAGIPVIRTVSCAEDLCALIAPVSAVSGPAGYCDGPITPERCAACVAAETQRFDLSRLGDRRGSSPGDGEAVSEFTLNVREHLERKRARTLSQFADVFDRVIFSTPGFRDYFCESVPLDPERMRVIGMGMALDASPRRPSVREVGAGEPVVFGLAGVLDLAKDQRVVVEAFSSGQLAERQDWRLRFFGGGDPAVIAPLLESSSGRPPRAEWSGPYVPAQLPDLLSEVDVGLSVSRFETFHRVTREYLLAGLPVVTSPTFGASDVVRHGVNGLVFQLANPASLASMCMGLLDDNALLKRLKQGAADTRIRTVSEEVDDLVAMYDAVLSERRRAAV